MKAARTTRTGRKVLLADIGGTNARFALLADGSVGMVAHMAVSDYGSFREALSAYLGSLAEAGTINAAILAAAGVIRNGRCALTNNSWVIGAAELCAAYGFSTVRLLNDFEAVAWSLPRLSPGQLLAIGGGQAREALSYELSEISGKVLNSGKTATNGATDETQDTVIKGLNLELKDE